MERYLRTDGVLIESMGHLWAAFSPSTGETALLNDESAAILEVLGTGAASTRAICTNLAADSGLEVEVLFGTINACWPRLIEAGLVTVQNFGQSVDE